MTRCRSAAVVAAAVALALTGTALRTPMPAAGLGAADPPDRVVVRLSDPLDAPAVAASVGQQAEAAPVVGLHVGAEDRARLEADPRVVDLLGRGTTAGAAVASSVAFLGAPGRWAAGHRGAGQVIAVIDTGVHPAFGGQVVGQACFAATEGPDGDLRGHCGSDGDRLEAYSEACFAAGVCGSDDAMDPVAGQPCAITPGSPPRACHHGSAVAAVAAGRGATPGMAPEAGVYAIRVFDPSGRSADLVDVYAALEHVLEMADAGPFDLASVNLSVATSSLFTGSCDHTPALDGAGPAFASVIGALRDRGIPVVVASGNDGQRDALAFPACIDAALSVGASDLSDSLSAFSNVAPGLDLLAPGTRSAGRPLGVSSAPGFATDWQGTSFAAPHVAGALALAAQEYPRASVLQRTWVLQAGGAPVTAPSGTYRRMGLRPPAAVLRGGLLFPGAAPIAGTARAAVGDFDGDGRVDVLAHGPGGAPDRVAYGRDGWAFDVVPHAVAGTYQPLVGQFVGRPDGADDIVWYAAGAASDSLWAGRADRGFDRVPLHIGGTYTPLVGDFDGDGWDDIFWYAPGPAVDAIWYGGLGGFTSQATAVSGTYRVAVGDVDGDGRDDLVFHGPGAAPDSLWRGTGTRGGFAKTALTIDGTATLVVGDLDGDGADDVLLYRPGPDPDPLWRGGPGVGTVDGGAGGFDPLVLSVSGVYVPAVGDVDGDGIDDVLWYAAGPGQDHLWLGRPSGPPTSRALAVGGAYLPLLGDVDGDGADDIVWFSRTAASTPVWWSHRGS